MRHSLNRRNQTIISTAVGRRASQAHIQKMKTCSYKMSSDGLKLAMKKMGNQTGHKALATILKAALNEKILK